MTAHDAEHNKRIFANNLYYYMQIKNKTQNDIVRDLGITASTVSDWVLGKKSHRLRHTPLFGGAFYFWLKR